MRRSERENRRIIEGEITKVCKKKDHHYWVEEKHKQVDIKREEEQDARVIVGEIRMINGGPVTWGQSNLCKEPTKTS